MTRPGGGAVAGLAACLAIVAYTSLAHLRTPQLEPDDYRYLEHTRTLGQIGWAAASTVENRWDHLWWIDTADRVSFFRPVVFVTYLADATLWGRRYELGLLVGNVILYTLCVLLVLHLARRWLGRGPPALVAAALFAAFFAHGEVIWYVAGRTDSLAAAAFLAALALHTAGGKRRYLAVGFFALALLTKELALTLPLVCLAHDLWIERRAAGVAALLRAERRLWALYLAAATAVWALRAAALDGRASTSLYPYLVPPTEPGFGAHLWTQLRAYGESLLLAQPTKPFLQPSELDAYTTAAGGWLILAAVLAALALMWRRRRLRFFGVLLLLTWLPVSMVYVSERYLLLPSVAVAMIAGLAVEELVRRGRVWGVAAMLVSAVWIGHQAFWLRAKNVAIMSAPRLPKLVQQQLEPFRDEIGRTGRVLLFDLPGDLFQAQFAQSMLRVQLDQPRLEVRVASQIEATATAGSGFSLRRGGPHRLLASRTVGPLISAPWPPFPTVSLAPGRRYASDGFTVATRAASDGRLELELTLDRPLDDYTLLAWRPLGDPDRPPHERWLAGRLVAAPVAPDLGGSP